MAAAESKFSHITVNADDEDDIVIQAGARFGSSEVEQASNVEVSDDVAKTRLDVPVSKPASARADKRDDYCETTLDDLESSPMSRTQKVILAFAVLGVVVAVAYCLISR